MVANIQTNLARFDVETLLRLRSDIDGVLADVQSIRDRVVKANRLPDPVQNGRHRGPQRGYKVEPKYRDPKTGFTWAGRGNRPKWVREKHLIKKAG